MKALKRILIAAAILLVLLVVGGFVFYLYLDGIIRSTVEKQASASLNLPTQLGSASFSPMGGKLGLGDLQIASPQGYSAPHMLTLGGANLAVSYGQLRGDPVRINALTLDRPTLVIEQAGGTLNFKKAFDSLPPGDPKPAGESKPLKMIIDELTVKDAKVLLRPGIPGLPAEINVPVSTFTLKNVGTGDGTQNGAAVKDVAMQVITALAAQANTSSLIPPELRALLSGDLSAVTSRLGAEAQKRILQAVPGEAGQVLSNLIANPAGLTKDPGKAVGAVLGDVVKNKLPTTLPSAGSDPVKAAEDALGGLLGKDKPKSK